MHQASADFIKRPHVARRRAMNWRACARTRNPRERAHDATPRSTSKSTHFFRPPALPHTAQATHKPNRLPPICNPSAPSPTHSSHRFLHATANPPPMPIHAHVQPPPTHPPSHAHTTTRAPTLAPNRQPAHTIPAAPSHPTSPLNHRTHHSTHPPAQPTINIVPVTVRAMISLVCYSFSLARALLRSNRNASP